jgi:PAS domain S-box-containing protein
MLEPDDLATILLDDLDIGIVVVDWDERVVTWNAWMAAATGMDATAAIGQGLAELFPEAALTRVAASIAQALQSGASSLLTHALHPAIFPLRTRAGRPMIHNLSIRPIGHKPYSRCLLQVTDVTVAVQRERILRERQNARYDAVVNSAPDVILTLDDRGLIQLANPAASRSFGYESKELVGQPISLLLTETAAWDELWGHVLAGEALHRPVEIIARRKDGGASHLEVSASRWLSDTRVFVTAILRDVNERRAAAEALYGLNQTLEQRVAERTAELLKAEEALRQSQKLEAIGQLTGGVAHDFNNLLTIIKSSTDLLRRSDLPEERRKRYVNAISETVDRASKLTGQLLAFARRQALKPEIFDASDRIRVVSDMLRSVVGSRIRVDAEIVSEGCFVEADANQFETALVNFVVNARDAMEGEGTLTIRVEAHDHMPPLRGHAGAPGAFVAISIQDTGSGISPDQLSQIFEPFFTTKEVGKGTGLGLSQVYGFAKQSGGDVTVESTVGRGTTFTLYLPRVEAGVGVDASGPEIANQPEAGRGRRVLVVEDNVEVGRFSTQILEDLGYETTWAANGAEALTLLASDHFDVVFSDVVMPGMSGVELGHEIRRRWPGLPVVLTSGYSHVLAEEGRHGFELLQKPYAAEELSRVLRRVTAGHVSAPRRSAL